MSCIPLHSLETHLGLAPIEMTAGFPAGAPLARACGLAGRPPAKAILFIDLLETPVALALNPFLDAILRIRLNRNHVDYAVY